MAGSGRLTMVLAVLIWAVLLVIAVLLIRALGTGYNDNKIEMVCGLVRNCYRRVDIRYSLEMDRDASKVTASRSAQIIRSTPA